MTRVPELDGVRGIAIAAVFLFHLKLFIPSLPDIFDFGWAGVDLFFVLSGFLITSILIKTKKDNHYLRNFYIRRALRIFPLYYLCLIGTVLAFAVFPKLREIFPDLFKEQLWYWIYLQNWLQIQPRYPSLFSHFWSLAIEEQFYILWAPTVWFLSRRALTITCIASIILSPILRFVAAKNGFFEEFLYYSTLTRTDCLAAGALIAICLSEEKPSIFSLRRTAVLIGGLGLIGFAFTTRTQWFFWGNWTMAVIGLTFTAAMSVGLVVYALSGSLVLQSSVLRMLGKYSYGLYVFHAPVLLIAAHFLRGNPTALILTTVVVACALSYLSWHLMEKRLLSLKQNSSQHVGVWTQNLVQ